MTTHRSISPGGRGRGRGRGPSLAPNCSRSAPIPAADGPVTESRRSMPPTGNDMPGGVPRALGRRQATGGAGWRPQQGQPVTAPRTVGKSGYLDIRRIWDRRMRCPRRREVSPPTTLGHRLLTPARRPRYAVRRLGPAGGIECGKRVSDRRAGQLAQRPEVITISPTHLVERVSAQRAGAARS